MNEVYSALQKVRLDRGQEQEDRLQAEARTYRYIYIYIVYMCSYILLSLFTPPPHSLPPHPEILFFVIHLLQRECACLFKRHDKFTTISINPWSEEK